MNKYLFFLLIFIIYYQSAISQCSPAPVLVYNSNDILCEGNTVNLTVSPTLASGCEVVSYVLVPPSGTPMPAQQQNQWSFTVSAGTYYARVNVKDDGSGTCPCSQGYSDQSNIIVVNPVPTTPSFNGPSTVLCGESASITASSVTNGTFIWTDAQYNFLFAGKTFTTPPLNAPTTFFVSEKVGDCEGPSAQVVIGVSTLTPPSFSIPNPEICKGESQILVVSNAGLNQTVRWFADNARNTLLGMGSIFQTPSLTNQTIYFADILQGNCYSNIVADTVKVEDLIDPIVADVSFCIGNTATVTHNPPQTNLTVNWYADFLGTQLVQVGNMFQTPILNQASEYFINYTKGNCKSNVRTVSFEPKIIEKPTVTDNFVCQGKSTVLSLSNSNGKIVNWYADSLKNQFIFQGNPFTTPVISTTMNYWVGTDSLGCKSNLAKIKVIAGTLPSKPTPTSNSPICELNDIQLNDITPNVTWAWTGPNGFASTDQNPTISNASVALHQGTYHLVVADEITKCESEATSIFVKVNPLPIIGLPQNLEAVENEPLQMIVSGGSVYNWSPATYLSDASIFNPIFLAPAESNTFPFTQTYTVNVTDAATSCSVEGTTTVTVAGKSGVVIYNTFTPNNDGKNDTWVIDYDNVWGDEYVIRVIDRNNVVVFSHEKGSYNDDWAGTDKHGNRLPEGSYGYVITKTGEKNSEILAKGVLNILLD